MFQITEGCIATGQKVVLYGPEGIGKTLLAAKFPNPVFIDTETGVDLNTCEAFHRAIDPALDELDPTFGAPYTLNVSSPGLDRPLKTQRDFDKCMGSEVEVKLYAPMKGRKLFEAVLVGYDGN